MATDEPAPGQVVDWLWGELEADLTGADASTVEKALRELVAGDAGDAAATLRDRFESVCERERPGLGDNAHPAACHLFEDATARPDERVTEGERPADETAADAAADD